MQPVRALLIHPGYDSIFIGFLENNLIRSTSSIHKHKASRDLLAAIEQLLHKNNASLDSLNFIAVTVGPGPFTTLRVAIATINGLAYGAAIPLIAIDGFELLLHEEKKSCATPYLGIMLNAFSDDVYCALYNKETGKTTTACVNIAIWCEQLNTIITQHKKQPCITLCGNGITLYQEQLKTIDAQNIIVKTDAPSDHALFEAMANIALPLWHNGTTKKMLLPLYMKATSALIKK